GERRARRLRALRRRQVDARPHARAPRALRAAGRRGAADQDLVDPHVLHALRDRRRLPRRRAPRRPDRRRPPALEDREHSRRQGGRRALGWRSGAARARGRRPTRPRRREPDMSAETELKIVPPDGPEPEGAPQQLSPRATLVTAFLATLLAFACLARHGISPR